MPPLWLDLWIYVLQYSIQILFIVQTVQTLLLKGADPNATATKNTIAGEKAG